MVKISPEDLEGQRLVHSLMEEDRSILFFFWGQGVYIRIIKVVSREDKPTEVYEVEGFSMPDVPNDWWMARRACINWLKDQD